MWENNKLVQTLGLKYPIVQAGMAGGVTTPELVAAASNAGGLGTLGAGYMSPEQIRDAIHAIRKLTDGPFAVNLFALVGEYKPQEAYNEINEDSNKASNNANKEYIHRMNQFLNNFRNELNIPAVQEVNQKFGEAFEDQLQVIIDEHVPVFSFTFGCPSANTIQSIKNQGIKVIGTATTVREARFLEDSGVDMIVAQGGEAGGHRGTFISQFGQAMVGTMALIPQIVDCVQIPVIASGGIMDGRGIVASMALGATGVQMGTAFVTSQESGAHALYKEAILNSTEESTVITRGFSGKPARGIRNDFINQIEHYADEIPEYPIQNSLTRDIRQAAAKQNKAEYMSLWAGQGSRLSTRKSASVIIKELCDQVTAVYNNLGK